MSHRADENCNLVELDYIGKAYYLLVRKRLNTTTQGLATATSLAPRGNAVKHVSDVPHSEIRNVVASQIRLMHGFHKAAEYLRHRFLVSTAKKVQESGSAAARNTTSDAKLNKPHKLCGGGKLRNQASKEKRHIKLL